ncbi:MAG: hypothetical protein N2662_12570 [Bacteroidales bacterium]|nr:hypothetical protein [Bacteroidales bacterium]
MKHLLIFVFFVLYLIQSLESQWLQWNFDKNSDLAIDTISGNLSLKLHTSNFVKDNEYFNSLTEGYTLIGFWAEPLLNYNISNRTQIWTGMSLVRFFGYKGFYKSEPIFGLRHFFTPQMSLTMGSLPFSQHRLPAPILDPERYYLNRVDNGARILLNSSCVYSDTWLSWDQFSFFGDSLQEIITAGSSNIFKLFERNKFMLEVPIFFLITHRGGQVVRPKQPIETLVNAGAGTVFTWKNERIDFKINPNLFIYRKLSSHPSQPFSKGWAFNPIVHLGYNPIFWELAWWHGNKFVNPRGEKIYVQVSTLENGIVENTRNVFVNKLAYQKKINPKIDLQLSIESYYFLSEKRLDYNFWVHFNWNFEHRLAYIAP